MRGLMLENPEFRRQCQLAVVQGEGLAGAGLASEISRTGDPREIAHPHLKIQMLFINMTLSQVPPLNSRLF